MRPSRVRRRDRPSAVDLVVGYGRGSATRYALIFRLSVGRAMPRRRAAALRLLPVRRSARSIALCSISRKRSPRSGVNRGTPSMSSSLERSTDQSGAREGSQVHFATSMPEAANVQRIAHCVSPFADAELQTARSFTASGDRRQCSRAKRARVPRALVSAVGPMGSALVGP